MDGMEDSLIVHIILPKLVVALVTQSCTKLCDRSKKIWMFYFYN